MCDTEQAASPTKRDTRLEQIKLKIWTTAWYVSEGTFESFLTQTLPFLLLRLPGREMPKFVAVTDPEKSLSEQVNDPNLAKHR